MNHETMECALCVHSVVMNKKEEPRRKLDRRFFAVSLFRERLSYMYWPCKKKSIIGLTLPTLSIYTVFIIIPIGMAIYYSFTKYSGIGKPSFIGLQNYVRLFQDRIFWLSLKNTMIILAVDFILLMVAAFFVAILLNHRLKGVNFCKALIFSPAIIAPIIVGIIWVYILDPKIGILNAILFQLGLPTQQWIGGDIWSPYSISFIYFWQQLGYIVTIYIAGLKMIPSDVVEASTIDGASDWQRIRYVIFPMMRPQISTVAILVITGVFKIFEIVQQTTNGGPNHMSETLVTYSYTTTFTKGEYGYGMCIAVLTFAVSLVIVAIYTRITGREERRGRV
ncbi:sugar ABC transporter permease [Shuttleworthella satelles]|uniref:carbohydrate ABC transporter permease n=1 Tax=Shuttleworthella satelles TaxID=177972 RepID=UPI0028D1493F|nr:sugar ABC transporter permease [Shuttleworthia satelles]